MADVNLLQNTENPENGKPKRPPAQPDFELSAAPTGGVRRFFQAILGRGKEVVPAADPSRMGMADRRKDQRILKETRSSRPSIAPLPDADEVFDVNLLSEELTSRNRPRQQLIKLALVTGGAILVVGLAYLVLEIAQRSVTTQITEARNELVQVKSDIDKTNDDQNLITATVKKLAAIQSLIDRHIKWTNFFTKFETYTLKQVHFGTSFTGDINGNLTLTAKTDTYESLAKQFLLYQKAVERGDFISSFTIASATRTETEDGTVVTFTVGLQILPSAFVNAKPTVVPEGGAAATIKAAAEFVHALCYLRGNQADLSYFPSSIQNDLIASIQGPATAGCDSVTADQLEQAQIALRTDADNDGLNSLLENLNVTSDASADTDNDSQTDLSEFIELWNSQK